MKTGKILISDLKKDVDAIQEIANSDRLLSQFLTQNEKFIHNIIHQIVSKLNMPKGLGLKKTDENLLDYETLQQVGRLSLYHAMKRYTGDKNATLSTFAYRVIANDIIRHIKKQLRIKFYEESLESFARGGLENGGGGDYNERHFMPLYPSSYQFEDEILNRIVFEQHFEKFSDEQKLVYRLMALGKTSQEIRQEIGLKRRQLRKIVERELPQKIEKMRRDMNII